MDEGDKMIPRAVESRCKSRAYKLGPKNVKQPKGAKKPSVYDSLKFEIQVTFFPLAELIMLYHSISAITPLQDIRMRYPNLRDPSHGWVCKGALSQSEIVNNAKCYDCMHTQLLGSVWSPPIYEFRKGYLTLMLACMYTSP
jgi:hypothetical protein